MYDALSIAAFADELNESYIGGRIQQVVQVDSLTLAFEIYALRQRRWLTTSAHPTDACIRISERRAGGDPDRVSPLLLLLRKYARGGRIISVSQPRYERILRVSIAKPRESDNNGDVSEDDGHGPELDYTELYLELMGRRSNIIYTDSDGRILDAIKRVSTEMSRVRPIRPGATYVPPPPQAKADPLTTPVSELLASVPPGSETIEKWLVRAFVAISPQLAREVAARADLEPSGRASELTRNDAEAIGRAMRDVFGPLSTGTWDPTVYIDADGSTVFSPIALLSLERQGDVESRRCASISMAAEVAWETAGDPKQTSTSSGRHAVRRQRLLDEVTGARERISHRVRSLEQQVELAAVAEEIRLKGEAIYAAMSQIEPRQSVLHSFDGLTVELDPLLSASENAQEYFERYRKARSAEEHVPALIDAAMRELDYVDQLRLMVEQAESYDEIESVRIEWLAFANATQGVQKPAQPKGSRPSASARKPRSFTLPGGHAVYVGRSGRQNDAVTFEVANPGDLWLHARDMPGAHVILRTSGTVDDTAVEQAAALAAWYSDGRLSTSVPVDVTERRYVRKIKGSGPGMVTYRNERTINVRPMSEGDLNVSQSR